MSDEPNIDDGWDELLELPPGEPAAAKASPSKAPVLPRIPPPPLSSRPATRPAPPKLELRVPGPHAASVRAGAPRLAPPPTVAPRPASQLGVPPPPEFLALSNSAELPLENEVRDDTAELRVEPSPADSLELHIEAPLELDADESESETATIEDELDIDISDDALQRVARVDLIDSRPGTAPAAATPTARTPAPKRETTGPGPTAHPRPAPFASALPSRRARPLGLWIGVGAGLGLVISIVAILWATSDPPSPEPAAKDAAAAAAKPPRKFRADTPDDPPPEASPAPTTPTPTPTPTKPESATPVPEPKPETEPKPEAAVVEPPSSSVVTVARDDADYRRAAAEFEQTGSQASLLAMTTTACALRDGPRARAAFRKLVGRTLRSEAIVACRASRVDVSANVEGYTGPELLAQARAALAEGDATTAFDKAHASNKVARSSEAVLIKGLAACRLGDGDQAERLLPHVAKKARAELRDGCKAAGIELRG